ncbi:hypothetical protein BASA81_006475 [Batrachochytrium salamandrivorans]|nr:hypothetical protein BASA81_006475 [Batrachochytrium salamandrivorans]
MLRKQLLAGLAVSGGAGYVYDVREGGAKVNRSLRTGAVAIATFIDYKFMLGNSNLSLSEIHLRVAKRWLWVVQQNGGLYSKIAQVVSSMNHVLPPEYIDTLSVIQDRAPFVGPEQVEQVIFEEFGKTSGQLFRTFDLVPIASASIAQVHRATLQDGTVVAVKIQKPDIKKQIAADLLMYRTIAGLIDYFFELPIMWSVPYTCEQLMQETNFRIEHDNALLAEANIEPALRHCITIPKVFGGFSTSRVLTCEWIDGIKVTDREGIAKLGFDPKQIMQIVTQFFSHQLFVSGHLHADPHPGNILLRVRPGTTKQLDVVVIDHGLYCHEPSEFRENYALLWKSIVMGDTGTLKLIAERWGIHDHELFASFQLFRPYNGKQGAQNVTSAKVSRAEVLQLQASVKQRIVKMLADTSLVPPELSLVGRNLNLIRSLNKALDSPVNRPRIMSVYANRGVEHGKGGWSADVKFNLQLLAIELMFQASEWWRLILKRFSGKDNGGFEAMLEQQLSQNVEQQLGFKLPDNVGQGGVG